MSRYPAISIYNSTDFISNENHYRNAKEASHISKNWWSLLGLSDHENELNIDGLKICNIYETKILKSLSTVLYCISTITNAVKKLSINKTIIVEPSVNHAKPNGVLTNYNIYEIFKDAELEDTVFMVDTAFPIDMEFTKYIIQHRINSIMYKLATFSPLDIIKYFNVNKNKMTSNSIVISNSKRWLEQFIINIPKRYSITILSDNVSNLNKNFSRPATGYNISNYYFNEINLKKYFDVLINSTISDFYSLKNEYAHLSKLLRVNKPLVYITIDISNANEFVKLWAMKNAKVKVVLAQEAACSLDYSLSLSLNHHFKPQLIKIERWVIGKHIIENYFKKNNL